MHAITASEPPGKEGWFESARGLPEKPCTWAYSVACDGEISGLRGYETGTVWDWRARAGTRDVSRRSVGRGRDSRSRPPGRNVPANRKVGVARVGPKLTTSFAR